jgi:hypothetical protein
MNTMDATTMSDNDDDRLLWREAGTFVAAAGAEQIIAFEPTETDVLLDAFEWNEVAVFRKIRSFVHSVDDAAISSTNRSFYLLVATLIAKAWGGDTSRIRRIVHDRVRYSPFFEAFKLATEIDGGAEFEHIFLCRSAAHQGTFAALHEAFELEGVSSNRILAIKDASDAPLAALAAESAKADLVFLETFRGGAGDLKEKIETVVGAAREMTTDLLVIAKGTWGDGIAVQDVFEQQFELLSMRWVGAFAERQSLFNYYIELAGYDRQSLLPFEGDYSVFVLYLSRTAVPELETVGFRRLEANAAPTAARSLQIIDDDVFGQNYYAEITGEIPPLDDYTEPDWTAWKQSRDWDPGTALWGGQQYAHEMDLLSNAMSWRDQPDLADLVVLLDVKGIRGVLSPRMTLLNAIEKWKNKPLDGIFFVLLSFEIADYEGPPSRYLLRCLVREAPGDRGDDGDQLDLLIDAGGVGALSRRVIEFMAKRDERINQAAVREHIPNVVDALYRLRGADRSRYLVVRTALETFSQPDEGT